MYEGTMKNRNSGTTRAAPGASRASWFARAASAPLAAALACTAALLLLAAPPAAFAVAAAPPITVPFDHLSTGFELDGVHRDLPCESCHLNAVFKGTPRACGVCHAAGSRFNATPKTQNHVQSTNNCAACHDTTSFRPAVHFSHADVLGACASCHNGVIAQGEGKTHPATSQACEACHTVMSWNPPKAVDHAQIPLAVAGFCVICHNGVQASGKNPNHVATNLECGDCHLTNTWTGATFDHSGIVSGCVTCHNGTTAVGKQGNHMPTSNLCENCHTTGLGTKTPSWAPSLFDHTQMSVSTCQTCHSGSVKITTGFVTGQPGNHVPPIPSNVDCGVCHGNNPAAETWTVIAASIATLHSGLSVSNCLLCHAGQTFAGVPAPYTPMTVSGVSPTKSTPLAPPHIPILPATDCSACHGAAYQAGGFGPATAMSAAKHAFVTTTCDTCHDTGKSFYVGGGTPLQLRPADHINASDARMATGDCSGCHETKDWNSTAMPAGHMPNPANLACSVCHTGSPTDYTAATLAANAVLHTGIGGNCGQCHGNDVAALTWYNNFTPKDALLTPAHIPYLTGTDCSSCHSSSTYAAGGFGPMNMTQAKHAFVPTSCDTCHEAGLSFYLGAASPALQGRPADHTTAQHGGAERLQPVPHHRELEQHGDAGRPHAESREPGLQRLPHGDRQHARELRGACEHLGAAHRHQRQLRPVPRRHDDAAHVLQQQRQPEGRDPDAGAHSVPVRHGLQLLPRGELRRRRLRTDEHDAGQARVRADDLRYLPRGRTDLLSGRREPRRCRVARPTTRPARWSRRTTAACCHNTDQLEQHGAAGGPHAEPRQPGLHRLPHRRAQQLHHAREHRGPAHRHHAPAAPSATAARRS